MKAAQIKKFEGSKAIEIVDIPEPTLAPGQVLVKVYASSVNPFDIKFSEGALPNIALPRILGGDVAGVVTKISEGVEDFSVGNKVYGGANALAGATGAFAEVAATPAGFLAKMPSNIDFNEAAAVVLTGTSAVQALLEHIKLRDSQK